MSMYEIIVILDTTETRIIEMDKKMIEKKDNITTKFEREIRIAENMHKEDMEKALQPLWNKMETKFKKRSHTNENFHRE